MSVISIGKLRYDIVSDTSSFERGVKGSRREASKLTKEWKESLSPLQRLQMRYKQLQEQLQVGKRGYQSFQYEQRRAYQQFVRETQVVRTNTAAHVANNRARAGGLRYKDAANLAGAGISGLGMGGAAAGAGRMLGLSGMFGIAGLGVGAGYGAIAFAKDAVIAFADLERQVMSLKVVLGDTRGMEVADQLRKLARETPLTTNALIRNTKVWASYGNETSQVVDIMRRLGDVSGGNVEQMNALTLAFSQVVAQGKLMGQEKNQLINAGFSLKEIAKAAGIEMSEFADAMKDGEIRSEHLMIALVRATEEGGIFFNQMQRQANTLGGSFDQAVNAFDELKIAIASGSAGPLTDFNKGLTQTVSRLTRIVNLMNEVSVPGLPSGAAAGLPGAVTMGSSFVSPATAMFNLALQVLNHPLMDKLLGSQEAKVDAKKRAEMLAGMSDNERKDFLAAEAEQKRLDAMTPNEREAYYADQARTSRMKARYENEMEAIQTDMEEAADERLRKEKEDWYRKELYGPDGDEQAKVAADFDMRMDDLAEAMHDDEISVAQYSKLGQDLWALRKEELKAAKKKDEAAAEEENQKRVKDQLREQQRENEAALRQIDRDERKEIADLDKINEAGQSFGPGSKEEYYFLRDKELADRKHQQIMAIQKRAQQSRDKLNTTLIQIKKKLKPKEESDVTSVE